MKRLLVLLLMITMVSPAAAAPKTRTAKSIKVTKAIAGRFEESRIANCIISKRQPCALHSFRIFSSDSALTSLVSTTLYRVAMRLNPRTQACGPLSARAWPLRSCGW